MKKVKKTGQLEIGFNWIYIMIAGAVILMFFVGIVVRQKVVSEQKLSGEVLRKLDGIFAGAGLSEQTFTFVEVPQLALKFTCDETTGYSDYAFKGAGIKSETSWQMIFAPEEINTPQILTWTLEWQMPFKVGNLLFVSAPNIKYYIFSEEYDIPIGFKRQYVDGADEITYNGEEQVRLVLFDPNLLDLPKSLRELPDNKVTAVVFSGNGAIFYQKSGDGFTKLDTIRIIGLISPENPLVYAAMFSTEPGSYDCNVKKGLKRLEILSRIYGEKTKKFNNYYARPQAPDEEAYCAVINNEAMGLLFGGGDSLEKVAVFCSQNLEDCGLESKAQDIEIKNNNLINEDCAVIY